MLKIYNWSKTDQKTKKKIMQRAMFDISAIKEYAREWIDFIRENGDEGVLKYIRKFDNKNFKLKDLRVSEEDIADAYTRVNPKVIQILKDQIDISRSNAVSKSRVNKIELKSFVPGVQIGYRISPLDSVGLTIPAGQVPLPTVMQILAVTAKAAGVPRVAACYPPTGEYPEMLVAGDLSEVDEIYRVGGIAGIASLAYGTETIKPVLKISGPGSIYTQAAKLLVFGKVTIDMVAGPSEALVLADKDADPKFCAAEILARAEHAGDAAGVVVTDSLSLSRAIAKEVARQFKYLGRKEIIKKSLEGYSAIVLVKDMKEAIEFTNEYSVEHLVVLTKKPFDILPQIKNAGSIFLGEYAPVAIGDYASGTNHILPTGNWPQMVSAVGVETFQKKQEIQYLSKEGLENLSDIVDVVSGIENLDAHWNSVAVRLNKKERLWDKIRNYSF